MNRSHLALPRLSECKGLWLVGLVCLLMTLTTACSGPRLDRTELAPEPRECLETFEELDTAIRQAEVRDHGERRLPGLPWLRSNRLLAALGQELDPASEQETWNAWLDAMAELDIQARRLELANLLGEEPHSTVVSREIRDLRECQAALNERVLGKTELRTMAQNSARVPDDYRIGRRWMGLYPITRLFVLSGVNNLHEEQANALASAPEAELGEWGSYQATSGRQEKGWLKPPYSKRVSDGLGIPHKDKSEWADLFQRHTPVWRIDQSGDFDQLGRPFWGPDGEVQVDTDAPMEYRYLSFTRFNGEIHAQLNYMVWLPERPRDTFFDLLGGHLDGAIWRVTLDQDNQVIAGESLHVCGCYYMVFPGEGLEPAEQASGGEPIFVGPPLPAIGEEERLRLTRESRSHYLIHIDPVPSEAPSRTELALAPAETLRSLPHPEGRRGLYGDRGLVPGSERRERWLLWTMGVPSPGAMRQPGRHAIAFAGRRHFDDPDILEQSLESAD
ncbi:hypothetical protein J2T60_000813 [Natronospira proteinivora]|uniref:Uncharacterized protein n=1 Tax=Natronospira proteinivora TaxID=1807133 RepID=A0ABT1G976_9GAMM|nr:hypothetical protein [Natronospira proteinivora]MCP1726848.1 hypothetical protein [Natronospira proteinivora]